jgi:hypothetical protein
MKKEKTEAQKKEQQERRKAGLYFAGLVGFMASSLTVLAKGLSYLDRKK